MKQRICLLKFEPITVMAFVCMICVLYVSPSVAQEVRITESVSIFRFSKGGNAVEIQRNQNTENRLTSDFAKTSRACPPFCIQPANVAPNVETVAELEVLNFLQSEVSNSTGLIVDARLPEWFLGGSIPGAINLPFTSLDSTNTYLPDILTALGAKNTDDGWDFSNAFSLLIYGNGPWSDQSRRATLSLLSVGYPGEKLHHYRGGIQGWAQLGLTIAPTTPAN